MPERQSVGFRADTVQDRSKIRERTSLFPRFAKQSETRLRQARMP